MTINTGDVLELVNRGYYQGSIPAFNVARYQYTTVGSIADATAIADFTYFTPLLMGEQDDVQVNAVTYAKSLLNQVYPTPRFLSEITHGKPNGIRNVEPLPLGCCFRILKYSNVTRIRGNVWIAGVGMDLVTAGKLTTTAINEMTALGAYYVQGFTRLGRTYLGGSFNQVTHAFVLWSAYKIDPLVSYLTRRIPRN